LWFSQKHRVNRDSLSKKKDDKWSHDNLFSTLLGLFYVESLVYNQDDDILKVRKQ